MPQACDDAKDDEEHHCKDFNKERKFKPFDLAISEESDCRVHTHNQCHHCKECHPTAVQIKDQLQHQKYEH